MERTGRFIDRKIAAPITPAGGRPVADDALLHVGFEDAEGLLVPLDRHVQRLQHPLGGEVVGDDPLLDFDRLGRHAERLGVEAEVEDQLFGRAGDAAEVRVQARQRSCRSLPRGATLLICGRGLDRRRLFLLRPR